MQDRETEKGRLEEAFEKCDRDLDQLIVQHYAELTTAIRTYQSITERITCSRNKIKQVKSGEATAEIRPLCPFWQCLGFHEIRAARFFFLKLAVVFNFIWLYFKGFLCIFK